jgi:hypothetical protein
VVDGVLFASDDSDFASDFVSDTAPSVLVSALASGFFAAGLSLKSVAYQPLPFSWNPAAVTCLTKHERPQCGHSMSGASEIFCSASVSRPQSEHL